MSATSVRTTGEVVISADSHVSEDPELWVTRLPSAFRDQAPRFGNERGGAGFEHKPGGRDPDKRLQEMATDGVSAEVLYTTRGLPLFGLDDAALQEACFRVYNDWLIEYCQVAPDRLAGVACISVYDADHAVEEMVRCRKAGLLGAEIWQAPHRDLPFHSDHYERIWATAEDLGMPISLHTLTGHNYTKERRPGIEHYRGSLNLKMLEVTNALFDFIFYGILDRHPGLRLVIVESEIGWMPFYVQQLDYYYHRYRESIPPPIDKEPSEYFARQVYATFFNDAVGGRNFAYWGTDNCMWSSDYPHPNSTWPHSRQIIERDLGQLPAETRAKLVCENVAGLYGLKVPTPV